jgi:hypothetical protein
MKKTLQVQMVALMSAAVGCAGAPGTEDGAAPESVSTSDSMLVAAPSKLPNGLHVPDQTRPPINDSSTSFNPGGSPSLSYHGGRLLQRVQIVPVFWKSSFGNSVSSSALASFYSRYVSSPAMDWLMEYSGGLQSITRGSVLATRSTPSSTLTTVNDSTIRTTLTGMVNNGTLPAPSSDTLYVIQFPKSVTINSGSGVSCTNFCAYHQHFSLNGTDAAYAVLPDFNNSCGKCGSTLNDFTMFASHEIIEAVTDPSVGSGWYDGNTGKEIGDICKGITVTVPGTSDVAQLEWSNVYQRCILGFPTGTLVGLSGKAADLPGGNTQNGTPINLFQSNWGPNQIWSLTQAAQLTTVGGKCMDLPGFNTTDGTGIQYFDCNSGPNQQWLETNAQIHSFLANRCMDLRGGNTADGTAVQIFGCNATTAQKWTFTAAGEITLGGKCLDVPGGNTTDGTPVQLFTCNTGQNQTWTVSKGQIIGIGGKCLEIPGGNPADQNQLAISTCTGALNQRWQIFGPFESMGNKCLEAPNEADGTQLDYRTCNGSANQAWRVF